MHLTSGTKKGVNDAAYERPSADLELNTVSTIMNMMSELLGLVRSSLTSDLPVSAFLKAGEN